MKRGKEVLKEAMKELAKVGVRAMCHRGGSHEILTWVGRDGRVYTQAVACSPSGTRTLLNQRSQIRRKLREGGFQLT